MSPAAARQLCQARSNRNLEAMPYDRTVDLSELPTLVEIEDLCLKNVTTELLVQIKFYQRFAAMMQQLLLPSCTM